MGKKEKKAWKKFIKDPSQKTLIEWEKEADKKAKKKVRKLVKKVGL